MRNPGRCALAITATLSLLTAACSAGDDDDRRGERPASVSPSAPDPRTPPSEVVVFSGQGNDLVAYRGDPPHTSQVVVANAATEPQDGRDLNGQICFDPEDPSRFVAGEDTAQSASRPPGWGVFELDGTLVGELEVTQTGKLVPTYQEGADGAENYGCGFLPDGRIVTTDVGNQAGGDATGQLIVWFPPFTGEAVSYCKVDVALATGQGVVVTAEEILVAQARAGVFRYPIDALPTAPDPAGGCDGTDATGAPLATTVEAERIVAPDGEHRIVTPNGLALGPDGHLYVSSVINGVISEFTGNGTFVDVVLAPPDGDSLEVGGEPFSTGTPLGIGVDSRGNLYYADLGLVLHEGGGVGPGMRTGTLRRITFDGEGEPRAPEVLEAGLAFPDGVGILELR